MELHHHTYSPLADMDGLRAALSERFPELSQVLGAQLGALVRKHLGQADLKANFGGLKKFVGTYFPNEIKWRGRQGLDDVYDVHFGGTSRLDSEGAWQAVVQVASANLWSAITNPTIDLQFAWSAGAQSLFQAPSGAPLLQGLVGVQKPTKSDYQQIAVTFLDSLDGIDKETRQAGQVATQSNFEFTAFMRRRGLLPQWEQSRVDKAVLLFLGRLREAGAGENSLSRWDSILRASRAEARSKRANKQSGAATKPAAAATGLVSPKVLPDSRLVAARAIEYMSDSEIGALALPLASVMKAIASLQN